MAAGQSSRFGSNKQFIKIGDETLIRRLCRQVIEREGTPIIVTQNKNLKRHCKNFEIYQPKYYDTQLHSMLFSSSLWENEDKVILLWGDTIFTDDFCDKIFNEMNFKVLLSENKSETLGMVVPSQYYEILRKQIKIILSKNPEDVALAFTLYSKLKEEIENIELIADFISRDIDTQKELTIFHNEVILEDKI